MKRNTSSIFCNICGDNFATNWRQHEESNLHHFYIWVKNGGLPAFIIQKEDRTIMCLLCASKLDKNQKFIMQHCIGFKHQQNLATLQAPVLFPILTIIPIFVPTLLSSNLTSQLISISSTLTTLTTLVPEVHSSASLFHPSTFENAVQHTQSTLTTLTTVVPEFSSSATLLVSSAEQANIQCTQSTLTPLTNLAPKMSATTTSFPLYNQLTTSTCTSTTPLSSTASPSPLNNMIVIEDDNGDDTDNSSEQYGEELEIETPKGEIALRNSIGFDSGVH